MNEWRTDCSIFTLLFQKFVVGKTLKMFLKKLTKALFNKKYSKKFF